VDDGSFSIVELGTEDTAVVVRKTGFETVDILEQTIFGKMKDVAAYTKSFTVHDETAWKRR
jgi:hypothetical protein